MYVTLRTFVFSILFSSSLIVGMTNVSAADFEVVIAKGVLEPQGLRRGNPLSHGIRVQLASGGLLILRETSGCRQHHVYSGEITVNLAASAATGCGQVRDFGDVRSEILAGKTFGERVMLRFDPKADGFNPLAGLDDPCLTLPPLSEEKKRNAQQCPSGYLLSGVACSGAYCDNKRLRCCPYRNGEPDGTSRTYSSRWISEESGNNRYNSYVTGDFINGLTCKGRYCDDLFPHAVQSQRFRNTGMCSWTPWFSEEPPSGGYCSDGYFVAGMQCQGKYCDNLTLKCCRLQPQ